MWNRKTGNLSQYSARLTAESQHCAVEAGAFLPDEGRKLAEIEPESCQIDLLGAERGVVQHEDAAALPGGDEAADLAVGNLEVTLGGPPYTGYPCFSAPDDWLRAIKETGFDILTTSNNHCLDRGRRGLERTLMMTDSLHMLTLGTYRHADERRLRYPLLVEQNGIRFVFLTYTYDMNGFEVESPNIVNVIDTTMMKKDILTARSMRPDVIIAIMHWGTEYMLQPDAAQRFHAQWLFEQGVDHIIGGHPHVIQPTEYYPYSNFPGYHTVVWSQGNFISNMSAPHTTEGTMITLTFQKTGWVTRLTGYDCKVVRTTRPDYRLTIIK